MSVFNTLFLVTMVSFALSSTDSGRLSPLLTKIAQALECSQHESLPKWKVERSDPLPPSENVLIEMFVSDSSRVKVSILEHKSEVEATATIKQFARSVPAKVFLNLGDEAYSWGYNDAIAFRKGNLVVNVSAVSFIEGLVPMLDQSERASLRRTEEVAFTKSLARTIAATLSDLDHACNPMERFHHASIKRLRWAE